MIFSLSLDFDNGDPTLGDAVLECFLESTQRQPGGVGRSGHGSLPSKIVKDPLAGNRNR